MKKRVILILLLIAILLGRIIYLNYNQLTLLWNLNSVEVTVDKPLNSDKIKIEYGVSANYYNRFIIDSIPHREKYTVLIFDGEDKNEVPYEYGENDFLITYDNKYYLTFRHFKTNWRRYHDYNFRFYKKGNKIFIRGDIKGYYSETFDRPMIPLNKK